MASSVSLQPLLDAGSPPKPKAHIFWSRLEACKNQQSSCLCSIWSWYNKCVCGGGVTWPALRVLGPEFSPPEYTTHALNYLPVPSAPM